MDCSDYATKVYSVSLPSRRFWCRQLWKALWGSTALIQGATRVHRVTQENDTTLEVAHNLHEKTEDAILASNFGYMH